MRFYAFTFGGVLQNRADRTPELFRTKRAAKAELDKSPVSKMLFKIVPVELRRAKR